MLTGLIGGYPIGARSVADAVSNGRISKEDAQKLVILCNNAGPAFMFGVLGPMFPSLKWPLILWITQIFAAIITGKVLKCNFQVTQLETYRKENNFVTIVQSSLRTMANICGWIVIFRMILEFLNRWVLWLLPEQLRILLTGLIELSNGCILLTEIDNVQQRLLFASIMTTLGGFCVLMQTKSVFPTLSLKEYLLGKVLQCGISVILLIVSFPILDGSTNLVSNLTAAFLISMMILGLLITRNRKKEVAIP